MKSTPRSWHVLVTTTVIYAIIAVFAPPVEAVPTTGEELSPFLGRYAATEAWYLDRDAYTSSLEKARIDVTDLLAANPAAPVRAHLENAARSLEDATLAFDTAAMTKSLEELEHAARSLNAVFGASASGARNVSEALTMTAKQASREIVTTIHGFTYAENPHIRTAEESLTRGDEYLSKGKYADAVNRYRQAVDKAKVVFEGRNMVPPGADEDLVGVFEIWAWYRDGLLRGDTYMVAGDVVTDESEERFLAIFDGLGAETLAKMTREMVPLRPLKKISPELYLCVVSRLEPVAGRTVDYFIYFIDSGDLTELGGFNAQGKGFAGPTVNLFDTTWRVSAL